MERPKTRSKHEEDVLAALEQLGDTEFEQAVLDDSDYITGLAVDADKSKIVPGNLNVAGAYILSDNSAEEVRRLQGEGVREVNKGDVITAGDYTGNPEVVHHEFRHAGMEILRNTFSEEQLSNLLDSVLEKKGARSSQRDIAKKAFSNIWKGYTEEAFVDHRDGERDRKEDKNLSDSSGMYNRLDEPIKETINEVLQIASKVAMEKDSGRTLDTPNKPFSRLKGYAEGGEVREDDWWDSFKVGEKEDGTEIRFSATKGVKEGLVDPVMEALSFPGKVARGEESMYTGGGVDEWTGEYQPQTLDPEAVGKAVETAGVTALGSTAAPVPKGSLRTFGGRQAKEADLKGKSRAEKLKEQGASPEEIWEETGWEQGEDGGWRFEIDDSDAAFREKELKEVGEILQEAQDNARVLTTLGDILDHPTLYKNYPELEDAEVRLDKGANAGSGSFTMMNSGPSIDVGVRGGHPETALEDLKATLLHEVQHYLQRKEGFTRGGGTYGQLYDMAYEASRKGDYETSDDLFFFINMRENLREGVETTPAQNKRYAQLLRDGKVKEWSSEAYKRYQNLGGEKEARAVEDRLHLTGEEKREQPPSHSMALQQRGYAEGGDVQEVDPISGNEVPPGAFPEEVRDDIDAKLSEGEFVVPANVVRWFGLSFFNKLMDEAQEGLGMAEQKGRVGGEPLEEPVQDELPFSVDELIASEAGGGEEEMAFAEGGLVDAPTLTNTDSQVQMEVYQTPDGELVFVPTVDGNPLADVPSGSKKYDASSLATKDIQPAKPSGILPRVGDNEAQADYQESPLAKDPSTWTPEDFETYAGIQERRAQGHGGQMATDRVVGALAGFVPFGGMAMKQREKYLAGKTPEAIEEMIEKGVTVDGTPLTEDQIKALEESKRSIIDSSKEKPPSLTDRILEFTGIDDVFQNTVSNVTGSRKQGIQNYGSVRDYSKDQDLSDYTVADESSITTQRDPDDENRVDRVHKDLGVLSSGGVYNKGGLVARRKK